jgi:Holliday junction resolvase-like predicted endonuclease
MLDMISIEKGKLGESKVAGYFLAQGYHVFLPVFSYPECDMVIMKEGITQKVEVKATSSKTKGGNFMVSLRRIRNNSRHYTIHKFDGACADILAVYIVDEDRVVLLKANDLNGRTAVTIKKGG